MKRLIALLLLATTAGTLPAETLYVNDEQRIALRTGQGTGYRALRWLPAGTPLEVLETSDNFTRVRTPQGQEGWVDQQFLTSEPIARDRLAAVERKAEQLEKSRAELNERVLVLEAQRGHLSAERDELAKEKERLATQVAELEQIAAAPRQLADENRQLQDRIATLEQSVSELSGENTRLGDQSQREWFIVGASVLGGGVLLGLLLPAIGRRRRGNSGRWGDL